jgi:hypothetical protein
MIIPRFPGRTTKVRRAFWDEVQEAVGTIQKLAGKNVTIDEYPGKGTVVNANLKAVSLTQPIIALSGINPNCCIPDGFGGSYSASFGWDGTYQLDPGGPTDWSTGGASDYAHYPNTDCTGTPVGVLLDAFFTLQKVGSLYTVKVYTVVNGVNIYAFNGTGAAGVAISNTVTSCGAGFGGTATVTL